MKYLIDFTGPKQELQAALNGVGAHVLASHPLRYAALALDAHASSASYLQPPQDYLRGLAKQDELYQCMGSDV